MLNLDLTDNQIAKARWSFTTQRCFPDFDEEEMDEAWEEFCDLAMTFPHQAARLEAEARRQSRTSFDS